MRLNREDWLTKGLALLQKKGPEHLTLERLCLALKVTKGSFYHHFSGRDDYIEALMAYWREQHTEAIMQAANQFADAPTQSIKVSEMARGANQDIENAIRTWARRDKKIARHLQAVDKTRIEYLASLIALQAPEQINAELIAKLVYAHFVGVQQLGGMITKKEWQAMDELLMALLVGSQ